MDIGMIIDETTRIRDSKDKEDIRTDIHLSYCCGWRDGVNAILKFLESAKKEDSEKKVKREVLSHLENLVFDLNDGGRVKQSNPAEQTKPEVPSKSSKQAPEELKGCRTCRYNGGPVGAPKDLQDLMKIECLSPTWKCRTVFRRSCIYWQPKD